MYKETNSMDLKEEKEELPTVVAAFSHSWFFIRALQLVFSVSIVSLFLWYYSQFSTFPRPLHVYWKAFQLSMFSHSLERKYVFLVFNGILAFLAKSLVHSSPPPVSVTSSEFSSDTNVDVHRVLDKIVPVADEDVIDQVVEEEPEQAHTSEYKGDAPEADREEKEDTSMDAEQEDSEERKGSLEAKMCQQEVEEEEEQARDEDGVITAEQHEDHDFEQPTKTTAAAAATANEEYASTDELNRRFEEFIRKMKEEIRIEAQRQLVVV